MSPLPYRPCVGIMLINPAGHVFVGQRLDSAVEAWQMPQGGIDPGETPQAAAWRELGEEVGTRHAVLLAETAGWHSYDLPAELVGRLWRGRYAGQRQKWFAMRFEGQDAQINIATPEPEFRAWRWAHPAELVGLAVPFKRALYAAVLAEFAPFVAPALDAAAPAVAKTAAC